MPQAQQPALEFAALQFGDQTQQGDGRNEAKRLPGRDSSDILEFNNIGVHRRPVEAAKSGLANPAPALSYLSRRMPDPRVSKAPEIGKKENGPRKHALAAVLTLLSLCPSPEAAAAPGDGPPTERFSGDSAKGWQSGEVSQRDGSRAYGTVLFSLETFPSASGPLNGALIVTCARGELTVLLRWPAPMGLSVAAPQQMHWRFDNGAVQSEPWMSVPSAQASITPSPRDFLAAMGRAHRLTIGSRNNQASGGIELHFDLDGGKTAMDRAINARQVADRATQGCP